MSEETKARLLKLNLIVTGVVSISMIPVGAIWPSGFVWHGGHGEHYFQMIGGIYGALGAFMIYASKNPAGHRTFIWFSVVVNIVHSVIMGFQAANDPSEYGHLIGDVPILFLVSVATWYLMPPKDEYTPPTLTNKGAIAIIFVALAAVAIPVATLPTSGFDRTTYDPPLLILPHWDISDRTGSKVNLDDLSDRPTVIALFRGQGCYHCIQQLEELAKIESQFRERGVRLVAISDDPVSVIDEAARTAPLPFPTLSDTTSKLARSLGSASTDNWHGLLIVDIDGYARWLIAGSDPFMDFGALFAELDRLGLGAEPTSTHQILDGGSGVENGARGSK